MKKMQRGGALVLNALFRLADRSTLLAPLRTRCILSLYVDDLVINCLCM
jgi:hypothetical protein